MYIYICMYIQRERQRERERERESCILVYINKLTLFKDRAHGSHFTYNHVNSLASSVHYGVTYYYTIYDEPHFEMHVLIYVKCMVLTTSRLDDISRTNHLAVSDFACCTVWHLCHHILPAFLVALLYHAGSPRLSCHQVGVSSSE